MNQTNQKNHSADNIPQLRFPEFKDGWISKKYNHIYTFYSTNSFSRDKLNYNSGNIKNIHYGDIHTKFSTLFDIQKEVVPYVNNDIDLTRLSEDNYLKEGDLLIADASEDYNDIGKTIEVINVNNEKVISGLHTFHARPNKYKMALGFSGFMLQNWTVRKQVMKIAQGTKVLGLSMSRLGNIKLYIPTLPEQQKIATFLTSVDERIQLLQKQKEALEQYKKGTMQKIFSQQLRFKIEGKGGELVEPPDWEEKRLGEIGCTFNGLTGKTKEDFGEGKAYVQYMQIFSNSKININDFGFVKINTNEKQSEVQYGDVFFTTSSETPREIGTASVLLDEVSEVYLNSFCFGYRAYSLSQLVPEFARYLFRSEVIRKEIVKLAQGSTRFNMSKVELMKLKVMLPVESEQQKIASFLSAIDTQIEQVAKQIEQSKLFKKGLLQKMFV